MMVAAFVSVLFSIEVRALPPVRGERLFRLRFPRGEISFALAAPHEDLTPRHRDLPPVRRAAREACETWLQGDLFRASDLDWTRGQTEPGRLRRALSPAQMDIYRQIVGSDSRLLDLTPSAAAALVRGRYADGLIELSRSFEADLQSVSTARQLWMLNQVTLNPYLDEAVRTLLGDYGQPANLIGSLVARLGELSAGDAKFSTMPYLVASEALRHGRVVTFLELPADQSMMAGQLRLHGEDHLRAMLDELGPRFADPAAAYFDLAIDFLIQRETSARFFEMTPSEYGHLQDLRAKSLLGESPFFENDEAFATYAANLHAHWLGELAEAVEFGNALIVLDAERVIPGVNPRVTRTLLEDLESRGVEVTPLPADRISLKIVGSN